MSVGSNVVSMEQGGFVGVIPVDNPPVNAISHPVRAGLVNAMMRDRMMLDGYFREAELLLLEGASAMQVDRALENFGFPMGPHRVSDLGGNDVGNKTRIQLFKRDSRPDP